MSDIADLEQQLESLRKKQAEDELASKRPSNEDFEHNKPLIERLDRFTSSEEVLPNPWSPSNKEVGGGWANAQEAKGKLERRAQELRKGRPNAKMSELAQDGEWVQLQSSCRRIESLTSWDRSTRLHDNAWQDYLASAKAQGLRTYLEALHRNVIILEKKVASLEQVIKDASDY